MFQRLAFARPSSCSTISSVSLRGAQTVAVVECLARKAQPLAFHSRHRQGRRELRGGDNQALAWQRRTRDPLADMGGPVEIPCCGPCSCSPDLHGLHGLDTCLAWLFEKPDWGRHSSWPPALCRSPDPACLAPCRYQRRLYLVSAPDLPARCYSALAPCLLERRCPLLGPFLPARCCPAQTPCLPARCCPVLTPCLHVHCWPFDRAPREVSQGRPPSCARTLDLARGDHHSRPALGQTGTHLDVAEHSRWRGRRCVRCCHHYRCRCKPADNLDLARHCLVDGTPAHAVDCWSEGQPHGTVAAGGTSERCLVSVAVCLPAHRFIRAAMRGGGTLCPFAPAIVCPPRRNPSSVLASIVQLLDRWRRR